MFSFNINDHKYSNIHFIGIGGISMSGLAEILLSQGYKVSGSDRSSSKIVERLESLQAQIYIGHSKNNIKDYDLVIYTDAIPKDNEELVEAVNRNIETVDRATFLGALIRNYTNSIAVSGTHGKTSTTSMIATILNKSTLDPTILLGGSLDDIGGNVRIGNREHLLTEACEYKGNVLKYYPSIAIILNMEEDHMDYFKDLEHILDTFRDYTKNIDKDGSLIINLDDPNADSIIGDCPVKVISFSIDKDSDYRAENISFDQQGFPNFDLRVKGDKVYKVKLNIMGIHNIYNTLASIAATHILGIPMETIVKAIESYGGPHRRLEYKGHIGNVKVMDDYAHHPTEIQVTLHALKQTGAKIWCIFQPHTYTRTKFLMNNFSNSFKDADKVIVTDIFAAREIDPGDVHSRDLVEKIQENGVDAKYMESFEKVEDYLRDKIEDGDLVVTMGAGDVYLIGEHILEETK